jgi:peptidoglycan hydrolase CwlO-like protein
MPSEHLSNPTFAAALGTLGGAVVLRLYQLVRSRDDKQEMRIDSLLKEQGALRERLETMASAIGELSQKVRNLEEHRDDLLAKLEFASKEITALKLSGVEKDMKIRKLTDDNAELLMDLERVQGQLNKADKPNAQDK